MKNNDFCPSWLPRSHLGIGQKASIVFLLILLLTSSASAASRSINPGDDTIFWIIVSVLLSYVFLRKIWVSAILLNPLIMILMVGVLLVSYIAYKVVEAMFGFSNMIDGTAQTVLNYLTGGS